MITTRTTIAITTTITTIMTKRNYKENIIINKNKTGWQQHYYKQQPHKEQHFDNNRTKHRYKVIWYWCAWYCRHLKRDTIQVCMLIVDLCELVLTTHTYTMHPFFWSMHIFYSERRRNISCVEDVPSIGDRRILF